MCKFFYFSLSAVLFFSSCRKDDGLVFNQEITLTIASEMGRVKTAEEPFSKNVYFVKRDLENDWFTFSREIIGFKYEPGYEYYIKIREYIKEDALFDEYSYVYYLGELIRKKRKQSEGIPSQYPGKINQ